MAIVTAEEKKQQNPGNVAGLIALAILLAVVSVAAWQLIALFESARLGSQSQANGRSLSESNPELFAKEMKEQRDALEAAREYVKAHPAEFGIHAD